MAFVARNVLRQSTGFGSRFAVTKTSQATLLARRPHHMMALMEPDVDKPMEKYLAQVSKPLKMNITARKLMAEGEWRMYSDDAAMALML